MLSDFGQRVPRVDALLHGDRVEAFRRLLVALAQLRPKRPRPIADGVRGEERVRAVGVAGPDFHLGLGLEHADEDRRVLGDALLGETVVEALEIRCARKGQFAVRIGTFALHTDGSDLLDVQRKRRHGPELSKERGGGAHDKSGTPDMRVCFRHAVASARHMPSVVGPDGTQRARIVSEDVSMLNSLTSSCWRRFGR